MLAFYSTYPHEFNNIKVYEEKDLINSDIVEQLFDYCQILEGYITKTGWEFLISYYGYEKLFEIDKKSGWIDSENLEEYILDLEYEKELGASLESK